MNFLKIIIGLFVLIAFIIYFFLFLIKCAKVPWINNVEINEFQIKITGKKGLLFFKKRYVEFIEINDIVKIDKILEGKNHEYFAGVRLYKEITEVFGKKIDELDDEILNNEVIEEEIKRNSLIAEIKAWSTQEEMNDFYAKLVSYIDSNNVDIEEVLM